MARLTIFLLIAFAGTNCIAQQLLYNLDSLVKQYSKPNPAKQRDIINRFNTEQKIKQLGLQKRDTARFEFANEYGLVYKLPADNMPCLKPFITEPNPPFIAKPFLNLNNNPVNPAGQIPNPLNRNQLLLETPGKSEQTGK